MRHKCELFEEYLKSQTDGHIPSLVFSLFVVHIEDDVVKWDLSMKCVADAVSYLVMTEMLVANTEHI